MRRAAGCAMLALALAAVLSEARAQEPGVRFGITRSADTVTVGQAFEIRVRVRAPAGAEIRFPDNPDTAGTVHARDPRTIETADSVQAIDETAVYRVSAWDVGRQVVRLGDPVVTWQGREHRVPLGTIDVFVRSVLPADSALRVPKPARPLWETRAFPWWIVWLLLAALAIALGLWWWLRRRRAGPPPVVIDPYHRALKELVRIEAMGLVDAGERTRYVALIAEVLRDYLVARYPDASLALTSRELVVVLRHHPHVPGDAVSKVLHEIDLAKFAGWALTDERARALAREVRAIIEREHRASQPPPERKAA